jgi:hypothetical protein
MNDVTKDAMANVTGFDPGPGNRLFDYRSGEVAGRLIRQTTAVIADCGPYATQNYHFSLAHDFLFLCIITHCREH